MRPFRLLTLLGVATSVCLAAEAGPGAVAPCGLDAPLLDEAAEWAVARGSESLIVARSGCIALERYSREGSAETPRTIYSITKAITAVLLGMALDQGRIESLDTPASQYFPEWRSAPKNRITLRHLTTMTSGLVDPGNNLIAGVDPFAYVRLLPVEAEPGTRWKYNNWSFRLLFPVLSEAYGQPLQDLSRENLFVPLEMRHTSWVSIPQTLGDPPLYVRATAGDVVKFGQLLLDGGSGLLSKTFLDEAVRPSQDLNPAFGLLLWLNREDSGFTLTDGSRQERGRLLPGAPADLIAAFGGSRYKLFVVPSLDLVIVRFGEPVEGLPKSGGKDSFDHQLFQRVAAAAEAQSAPAAPSR